MHQAPNLTKSFKKVKKIGSKVAINFTYYFCYGFFNLPQVQSTDPNDIK